MRIAVMQPYVFPYVGYYQLVNAVDEFVFFDDVNYIKRGWINRNNILVNSQINRFSIPVRDISQNRLIRDVELHDYSVWCEKFIKTVSSAYRKAPFYESVMQLIIGILQQPWSHISPLAERSIKEVSSYIGLTTAFRNSGDLNYDRNSDAQGKVLSICKIVGADEYINPYNGRELYSTEDFTRAGIRLHFLKALEVPYRQTKDSFVPWLSIIDVLMHNPVDEVKSMLSKYELH